MKKIIISILTVVSLLFTLIIPSFAESDIKVIVNGKLLTFDQPPIEVNGRTLVPVRAISEAFGLRVSWVPEVPAAFIHKSDGSQIALEIGKSIVYLDGKEVSLDVPAQTLNGRTMVPLRFISEALGCTVAWDASTSTINITSTASLSNSDSAQTSLQTNNQDIKIFVGNKEIKFDQAPISVNGCTLAQADAFLQAINVTNYDYNNVAKILTAFDGYNNLEYQVGSAKARVNYKYYDLDAAPTVVHSYVMIPVSFTAKTYGAAVKWDNATNSIYITLDAGETVDPPKVEVPNPDNKPLDENGKEIQIGDIVHCGGFSGSVLNTNGSKILVYWDSKSEIIPDNDVEYWAGVAGVKWKSNQWIESKEVKIESSGY